jgi:hypothetical protein
MTRAGAPSRVVMRASFSTSSHRGQNLQGRHAEARAQADFEVNTRAEREIEAIRLHLKSQSDVVLRILHHVEGAAKQSL